MESYDEIEQLKQAKSTDDNQAQSSGSSENGKIITEKPIDTEENSPRDDVADENLAPEVLAKKKAHFGGQSLSVVRI